MTENSEELRDRLILAAVRRTASAGWTAAAIRAGAVEVGIDEVEAKRILRGGPRALFRAFNDWADARMTETLDSAGASNAGLSERVETAVLARFDVLEPYRDSIRRGIAFAGFPQNAALGLSCYCRTVDRIWRAAGDRPHDFSFYTKRALLGGILGATVLVWLEDRSEGCTDTRAFLRRRLADVLRIQKLRSGAKLLSSGLSRPFRRRPPAFRRGPRRAQRG